MIFRYVMFLFFPFTILAQEEKQTIYAYYKNGNIQTKLKQITINTLEVLEFYPNGQLKDSMRYTHNNGVGTRKIYRKNGSLKFEIDYGYEINQPSISKMYRPDGSLKTVGGYRDNKAFELLKVFNRRGDQVRQYDMNKGKVVKVPNAYKRGKHIRSESESTKFNKPYLMMYNGADKLKLKPGDLVVVKLVEDNSVHKHCQVEGIRDNLITFSTFIYDLSKSEHTLKYVKSWKLTTEEIKWVAYPEKIDDYFKFIVAPSTLPEVQ